MPKQEHKILEFHGGTNDKFDARDIAENQNAYSQFSIRNPGRLVLEGSGTSLYDKTRLNDKIINDFTSSGAWEIGYGLFTFAHDYDMDSTPDEIDTDFIVLNDQSDIDIYDPNNSNISTDIVQDGSTTNPSGSNWTPVLAADGSTTDGWTDAEPSVFTDGSGTASLINTLGGDKIDAGFTYSLTFTVAVAALDLLIGGDDNATGSSNLPSQTFIAKTTYPVGTHTTNFQATVDRSHLWFTAYDSSDGSGTIDNVSCYRTGWTDAKFTLGSRTADVKPRYYNVDGSLRTCDSNFNVATTGANSSTAAQTAAAITKNTSTLTLDNGSGGNVTIASGSLIQIDQEIIYIVTGATGTSFTTVIRGFANTKTAAHLDNTTVYYVNVPKYFGHIKDFRLDECATANSINTWVEDIQTPQPPNNTRKSDGTTGTLANSLGIQSLRIYDSITSSTANYPAESEKVVLEFGDDNPDYGIITVSSSDEEVTITTSGNGSIETASHGLSQGDEIVISNVNLALTKLGGTHEVKTVINATSFTIDIEGYDEDDLDFASKDTAIQDWVDYSATVPGTLQIDVTDTELPTSGQFWVHITAQTGVSGFNGVYLATANDNDQCYFKHASYASADTGDNTGQLQQLLGTITRPGEDAIDEDLKRKWNFAMSFTYDGPAQEVQESLLTMGYKITPSTQESGAANLINFNPVTIVQNGADFASNWVIRASNGDTGAGESWTVSGSAAVFDGDENGSIINTLSSDAMDDGERYTLTFTIAAGDDLNLLIGGYADTTGSSNLPTTLVAKTTYAAGTTHSVSFQSNGNYAYLWIVGYSDSEGSNNIDDVVLRADGYGSGETSIVVDDGDVFSANDVIMIGTEQIKIASVVGDTLTVTNGRGYNGTTAAHFANDSQIYKVEELTSSASVDWTGETIAKKAVIKTVYNHGVDEKTWNARINGFKIYMKDVTDGSSSQEWRLFSRVNFTKGTYQIFANDDSQLILAQPGTWSSDGAICTVTTGTSITIQPIDTYVSENMFTPGTIIDSQYKTAEVVGRRVYIGNIRQGGRTYPDRMLRSPINKFDTFPETNYIDVAVGDGDSIIELMSYGDRLLQFKKKKLFIINVSGSSEVLESEHQNAGIRHPSHVCKTNNGICWFNESGLWFFDGKQVANLTRHVASVLNDNGSPTFETGTIPGFIMFEKITNRVIWRTKSTLSIQNRYFMYDFELKAYQSYFGGPLFPMAGPIHAAAYTSIVTDSEGTSFFGFTDTDTDKTKTNFFKWSNAPVSDIGAIAYTSDALLWKSKDIDLGAPAVNKKIYKVYVTYKCTGVSGVNFQYATDASGSFSSFSSTKGEGYTHQVAARNYDVRTPAIASFIYGGGFSGLQTAISSWSSADPLWRVAELIPDSSINNIKSLQLRFNTITATVGKQGQAGSTSTTMKLKSDEGTDAYAYIGRWVYIYDGKGRFNTRRITAYDTTNKIITVSEAWTDNGYGAYPDATSYYIIGAVAPDFEVNDITIVYRPKRVK